MRMRYSCNSNADGEVDMQSQTTSFFENHYKYNLKVFSLPLFIPILFQKCLAYKDETF